VRLAWVETAAKVGPHEERPRLGGMIMGPDWATCVQSWGAAGRILSSVQAHHLENNNVSRRPVRCVCVCGRLLQKRRKSGRGNSCGRSRMRPARRRPYFEQTEMGQCSALVVSFPSENETPRKAQNADKAASVGEQAAREGLSGRKRNPLSELAAGGPSFAAGSMLGSFCLLLAPSCQREMGPD